MMEEQNHQPLEQDHQPLELLSGDFKGAQQQWTVPEKEGFAIVDTVTKVDYLFCCPGQSVVIVMSTITVL
jgi:hypothetical protein